MKKQNERDKSTTTVKEAINKLIDSYKLRGKFDITRLIGSWEEIMGTAIARRTDRLWVKDNKLFVKLNSPALKNELTIAKSKVLGLIEDYFGKKVIDDVIFL